MASGSLRATHASFAACVPPLRTIPVAARNASGSPSSPASRSARWSDHTIAGPSGRRSSSKSAKVSRADEKPTAAIAANPVGACAFNAAHARTTDAHQSSGSCSAHPGRGCAVAIGARVRARSSAPRQSAAFVALVPRSSVRTVPVRFGVPESLMWRPGDTKTD
jgi:hypothetical protein